MIDPSSTIILDLGSYNIRAGIMHDSKPRYIIPSVFPTGMRNFPIDKKVPLDCTPNFAISNGKVADKDRVNFIFASIFNNLFPADKPEPESLHLVMNCPPNPSKNHISCIGQYSFELLEADSILMLPTAYFSQIQFSLPNCVCINIGHDQTHVVAIENYSLYSPSIIKSTAAGSSLDLFTSIDQFSVYKYTTYQQIQQARKKKEDNSYSSLDFKNDFEKHEDFFPFVCGELLFNPKMYEAMTPLGQKTDTTVASLMEEPSVAKLVQQSIEKCHSKKQNLMWSSIIVTGGTSLMKGFRERMKKELREIAPTNVRTRLYFPEDPMLDAWQGARWMNDSNANWMDRMDYNEDPQIIFRKFC